MKKGPSRSGSMTDLTAPKSPESSQTHGQGWRPRIPFPTISSLMYLIIHSLNIRWMASSSRYFACHSWPASPSPQGAPGWGSLSERTCSWLWAWRQPDAEDTAHIPSPFSLKLEVWVLALGPKSLGEPILWPGHLFPTAHHSW